LRAFCVKHGYSGRRSAAELLTRFRAAPAGSTGEALTDAVRDAVLAQVAVLTALTVAEKNLGRSPVRGRPPRGAPPGRRDLHVAAKVGSDQRRPGARRVGRFPPSPRLAGRRRGAGRGHPVTKASGKYRAVHFQWACNKHLRKASTCFADNSRHASPWAAGVYARAIARGHDHPHAVRVLARAWIRVIYRCWIDGVPDDPNKHGSAGKLRDTATAA